MANIVPYGFCGLTEYPQSAAAPGSLAIPGWARGIYITLHPDQVEVVVSKFERWFAERSEVSIIDVGTSDKAGLGFIVMEWLECDVDQLFLAILDDEQAVADYSVYGRNLEG